MDIQSIKQRLRGNTTSQALAPSLTPERSEGVPPGDLPLQAFKPRLSATKRWEIMGRIREQLKSGTNALTRWAIKRELAYWRGPGRSWGHNDIALAVTMDLKTWEARQ